MSETVADPFGSEPDASDPFATPEEVRGNSGPFIPTPKLEDIAGRLVAMIPRKFEDDAPIPEDFRQKDGPTVRDRYTVDMFVLNGGELSYTYMGKVEGKENEREERTHTIPADEVPAAFTNVWRVEASLIGQLRRIDGTQRPVLLGVVRRGPQAADRRKGVTFDDVEAAHEKWTKNPKGNHPKFSWQVDTDITPEQRAAALSWWKSANITL